MIKVINAGLLSKEEFERNRRIPPVNGGYWLSTPADEGKICLIWSTRGTTIETSFCPYTKMGVRPVLAVKGLETAQRDEQGYIAYGGVKWYVIDDKRIISVDTLGLCEYSRRGETDISRSDVIKFIMEELLPDLAKKERLIEAGAEASQITQHPAADNIKSLYDKLNRFRGVSSF